MRKDLCPRPKNNAWFLKPRCGFSRKDSAEERAHIGLARRSHRICLNASNLGLTKPCTHHLNPTPLRLLLQSFKSFENTANCGMHPPFNAHCAKTWEPVGGARFEYPKRGMCSNRVCIRRVHSLPSSLHVFPIVFSQPFLNGARRTAVFLRAKQLFKLKQDSKGELESYHA